jgi:predicted dehydrogenase
VRGLIVGYGSIGRRHAANWAALELGPIDVCPRGELTEALRQHPDVVLVTNPTTLHVETACQALEAGAHVLVEKPLGSSLEGVPALLERAHQIDRVLAVAYNLRFHPGLQRIKALVEAEAIGKIVSARAEASEYLPDWHPWEDYRQSYSGRRDLGGGAVLTFSHELDTLCWLLGAPRRLSAMAMHTSRLEIDTEDVADMLLELPNQCLGTLHVDYVRRSPHRSLELIGEDGVLRWEYQANRLLQFEPRTRRWRIEEGDPRLERNQMYIDELRAFANAIQGRHQHPDQHGDGPQTLATGEQGAAVLAIALAALQSARDGQTIDFTHAEEPIHTWLSKLGR